MTRPRMAPDIEADGWFNAPAPLNLASLRGRVVCVLAFQMLCPGCVSHALPQAMRLRGVFDARDLAMIGLHAVFEHHEAQGSRAALKAFLEEYRIDFPVAIDAASPEGGVPRTMRAYGMQGTPTLILIDRDGRMRLNRFGHLDDIRLGAFVQALVGAAVIAAPDGATADGCDAAGCAV